MRKNKIQVGFDIFLVWWQALEAGDVSVWREHVVVLKQTEMVVFMKY